MVDQPRIILKSLVDKYGTSLLDNPRRCEALLRDFCGEHKKEIFVLVSAIRAQVPTELIDPSQLLPPQALYERLAVRLQDNIAFSPEASRWAVSAWTYALGLPAPVWSLPTQGATETSVHSPTAPDGKPHQRGIRRLKWTTAAVAVSITLGCGLYGLLVLRSPQQSQRIPPTELPPTPSRAASPAGAPSSQPTPAAGGTQIVELPPAAPGSQTTGADANSKLPVAERLDPILVRTIDVWIATLKVGDTQGHMALYGDPVTAFYTKRNLSRAEVATEISALMESYSGFQALELSDLTWRELRPTLVQVDFDKLYRATRKTGIVVEGKVRSQLTLQRSGSEWQIVGETDPKIYWTRTDDSEKRRIEAEQKASELEAALRAESDRHAAEKATDERMEAERRQRAEQDRLAAEKGEGGARKLGHEGQSTQLPATSRSEYQARLHQLEKTQAEDSAWHAAQSAGNVYAVESFLRSYPVGVHSREAQDYLGGLNEAEGQQARKRAARGEISVAQLGIFVKELTPERVMEIRRHLAVYRSDPIRRWQPGWIGALEITSIDQARLPAGFNVEVGDLIVSFGQKEYYGNIDPNPLTVVQDLVEQANRLGVLRNSGGAPMVFWRVLSKGGLMNPQRAIVEQGFFEWSVEAVSRRR